MKTFQDKVCLITGSTQGIGLTTALQLLRQGAYIVLNGRKQDFALPEKLLPFADRVEYVSADISDTKAAKRLIDSCNARFNKLDIVINNAGISSMGSFEATKPQVFDRVISVNLMGSTRVSHYAIPLLKESNGFVLFVSSIAGMHGMKNYSAYSASKMALTSLCQSLRKELSSTGIGVGISYLSFTENDTSKRFLSVDGNTVSVPQRKGMKVHSQIDTSNKILNQIEARKPVSIHSRLGTFTNIANRISPALVHSFLARRSGD